MSGKHQRAFCGMRGLLFFALLIAMLAGTDLTAQAQPPPPPAPETTDAVLDGLNRALQEVVTLRALASARMTEANFTAVLPVLRALNAAQGTLRQRTAQAIAEERRALLALLPDAPSPPDGGERIRRELTRYREVEGNQWAKLAKAVGGKKAELIHRIVSPPGPPAPPAPLPDGPGPPRPPDGDPKSSPKARRALEPHLALPDLIALIQERLSALRNATPKR